MIEQVTTDEVATLEAIPLSLPFTHADGRRSATAAQTSWQSFELLFVRLETRAGLVGWGECFAYTMGEMPRFALETKLSPQVVGRRVPELLAEREQLARSVHTFGRGGATQYALSGLDIALWDLAGKLQDRPIHQLLGEGGRTRFPAYASLFRYDDPDIAAETAARAVGEGFGAIKLHETAEPSIRAVREASGDDISIATDVNCRWTHDQAVAQIHAFERHDLAWVEEPLWPPDDQDALARLRREVAVPLAAGESEANATTLRRLAASDAVDILQPSVIKFGGITEFRKLLDGVVDERRIVPHSYYWGPGLLATLQMASHLPDTVIECIYADPDAQVFGDEVGPADGTIGIPDGPGLGADPDPDFIAAFRTT